VAVLAGIAHGPDAAILAEAFVMGGVWILARGFGRQHDTGRFSLTLTVGGGLVVLGFGVYLVVVALK
jgi:hypothetical protein